MQFQQHDTAQLTLEVERCLAVVVPEKNCDFIKAMNTEELPKVTE